MSSTITNIVSTGDHCRARVSADGSTRRGSSLQDANDAHSET